jgi:hypothetical protein
VTSFSRIERRRSIVVTTWRHGMAVDGHARNGRATCEVLVRSMSNNTGKTGRIAARPEVMSHGITETIATGKYTALSRAWLSVKIPLPHAGQAR